MERDVIKTFELRFNMNKLITYDDTPKIDFGYQIAFEEIATSFAKQEDEKIANYLYNKYKDTDVARVYVLSKSEFEDFLKEMLPLYIRRKGSE